MIKNRMRNLHKCIINIRNNDQVNFKFMYMYTFHNLISNTILAIANRQAFCKILTVTLRCNIFSQFLKDWWIMPSALMMTDIMVRFWHCHICFTSLFKSWFFSTFSFSFSANLVLNGHATSIPIHFLHFFWSTTISSLECSVTWSVYIVMSHKIFKSSFSITIGGLWSYHFSMISFPFVTQIQMDNTC